MFFEKKDEPVLLKETKLIHFPFPYIFPSEMTLSFKGISSSDAFITSFSHLKAIGSFRIKMI